MLKLYKAIFLMAILLISFNCRAQTLQFGVIAHSHTSKLLKELHSTEVKAIQNALHKKVKLHFFYDYSEAANTLKEHPKKYSFIYAKVGLVPQLMALGNWEKIAQVLERNPETNKLSSTYSSYLIAGQKSDIRDLDDLANKKIVYFNTDSVSSYSAIKQVLAEKKITSVHWIKTENLTQALAMVASGKADALGVWDNYFAHYKDKENFKIVYKIGGLPTPILYGNTKTLSSAEIEKIKATLQKGDSSSAVVFTYH